MTTILVTKRSVWEQYNRERELFGNISKASLKRMHDSHLRHRRMVDEVAGELKRLKIKYWLVEGADISFKTQPGDEVVCVGGDGTVLSSSHNCGPGVDLMAINSDPLLSKGRLCNAIFADVRHILDKKRKVTLIPRMQVEVDGQVVSKRVLNEALFSHTCPAAMTRFSEGKTRYACSGMWVGTGAGSTGAIKSAGGEVLPIGSKLLQAVIREPFDHPDGKTISTVDHKFKFTSKTADATLYLDGPFLRVPVGFDQTMRFTQSPEPLRMIGPEPQ
jgi:NAD+ kinase